MGLDGRQIFVWEGSVDRVSGLIRSYASYDTPSSPTAAVANVCSKKRKWHRFSERLDNGTC